MADGCRVLVVVAAPLEAEAVLRAAGVDEGWAGVPWTPHRIGDGVDLVVSGVGKACAAGATVAGWRGHEWVLSLGIGGALPGSGLALGTVVGATWAVLADEGVRTGGGFEDLARMGFPPVEGMEAGSKGAGRWMRDEPGRVAAGMAVEAGLPRAIEVQVRGVIATVSTCSGTDALAAEVVARTGAVVEAMEGAAVGVAARRLSRAKGVEIGFGEVRVVSNTTGDRERQVWDVKGASPRLGEVARAIIEFSGEIRR
ncbi:MAG: futalosine hydrolase [Phycisphaeraceae bacterium]|nr:futalosine hydrolase [Phycisphaeraceae bacterium]